MSLFGLILLILFLWFVLRPVLRFFLTVRRIQSEARRAAGQERQGEPKPRERKAGWTPPAARRKKFGSDIGEYVEYEEITATSTPPATKQAESGGHTRVESQIVDVEWEDIK